MILLIAGGCTLPVAVTRTDGDLVLRDERDMWAAEEVTLVAGDLVVQGTDLAALHLPRLTGVTGSVRVWENPTLLEVSLPALTRVGADLSLYDNPRLPTLEGWPALTEVAGTVRINRMPGLTAVELALSEVGGLYLYDDTQLATVHLAGPTGIAGDVALWDLPALASVQIDDVAVVRGGIDLFDNDALTNLSMPDLTQARGLEIHHCDGLRSPGSFPALEELTSELTLHYNAGLRDVSGLGALSRVGAVTIRFNPGLASIDDWPLARVAQSLTVANNRSLTKLTLTGLVAAAQLEIVGHDVLDTVALPQLDEAERVRVVDNPRWPSCAVAALLDRLDPGEVECSGNGPDPCEASCTSTR